MEAELVKGRRKRERKEGMAAELKAMRVLVLLMRRTVLRCI
jgi:hypothetical protein